MKKTIMTLLAVLGLAAVVASTTGYTAATPDGAALYAGECEPCHGTLANSTKKNRSAAQIQAAINGDAGGMGYITYLAAADIQAIATALSTGAPAPVTGPELYTSYCSGCHGALASSTKKNRTAAQTQAAINGNIGGMGSLTSLTAAQVQLIATALTSATPSPVVVDGPTLYANNCAGCHNALATTNKPGRTAAQITSAITGNVGGMGYLSTLNATQITAIANALPAAPPPPVV
ncbi:MAG: hypothetical protein HZA22_03810, partial [Nitrospirae bacterium]|nr:hypothetical protein [Nitrospirota bacterium]